MKEFVARSHPVSKQRKSKAGRPCTYTTEIGEKICERIMRGERIRAIGAEPGLPHPSVIYEWVDRIPEFAELFYAARRASAHAVIEEAIEIADDDANDWLKDGEDGSRMVANNIGLKRAELRINLRKYMAAKFHPGVYGDKLSANVNIDGLSELLRVISQSPRGTPQQLVDETQNDA